MGALRWNERLRGGKPAVWLHWVGKDPIEVADKLPAPDHGTDFKLFRLFRLQDKFSEVLSLSGVCLYLLF